MEDRTQRSFYVGRPAGPSHVPRAPAAENAAWTHASGHAMAMDAPWSRREEFSDSLCNPKRPAAKALTRGVSNPTLMQSCWLLVSDTLVRARPSGQINPVHEVGELAVHSICENTNPIH